MSTESLWEVKEVSLAETSKEYQRESVPVLRHPLFVGNKFTILDFSKEEKDPAPETYDFEDPLGATIEENDSVDVDVMHQLTDTKPRSKSLDNTLESRSIDKCTFDIELPDFAPWREKRVQILELARSEKPISSDPLRQRVRLLRESGMIKPKSGTNAPVDVPKKVAEYREELNAAWKANQRVESMRIATEVGRLLISTDSPLTYPQNWLGAADVLDLFGQLVYERILAKSNEERHRLGQSNLPTNFTSDDVPPQAKDTAKHWFLKVADVKELVPRFYVETALIGCLQFLDSPTVRINLERLAAMCSKFPQDVSAAYARVFICRMAMRIDPADRAPHWRALLDALQVTLNLSTGISPWLQHKLCAPALEWMIQCVAYGAHTLSDIAPLWEHCKQPAKSEYLIPAIINGLPSKYLAMYAVEATELAISLKKDFIAVASLGKRLVAQPPCEDLRNTVKKLAWRRISELRNYYPFLNCIIEWTKFTARYFQTKDVEKIMQLACERHDAADAEDQIEPGNLDLLIDFAGALIENRGEAEMVSVMTSPLFSKIVSFVSVDMNKSADCARRLLTAVVRICKPSSLENFQMAHFIIDQCAVLWNSIHLEGSDDEILIAEQLICSALCVQNLTRKSDLQQSIDWITRARATFGLSQAILLQIISLMINFTMFCYRTLPEGAKKADFMRTNITCLSVTVPAVHDLASRFRLSCQTVQISLLVNFLPQIDSSTRRCLETLEELQTQTSPSTFCNFCSQFLAILVYVPDSPARGKPLYYFDKFYTLVDRKWDEWKVPSRRGNLVDLNLSCARYLCATRGGSGSRIVNVADNDTLYGGDEDFIKAVDSQIERVMDRLAEIAVEDPLAAAQLLELVLVLFNVNQQIRSVVRGLTKRVLTLPDSSRKRSVIDDLKRLAKDNENAEYVVRKLEIL